MYNSRGLVKMVPSLRSYNNFISCENILSHMQDLAIVPILAPDSDDDSDSDIDTSDCEQQQNFTRTCTCTSTYTEPHNIIDADLVEECII